MLKLNIGVSQKVGQPNYGSRGASAHLELELESELVAQPAQLQERIRHLFALARDAVSPIAPDSEQHAAALAVADGEAACTVRVTSWRHDVSASS